MEVIAESLPNSFDTSQMTSSVETLLSLKLIGPIRVSVSFSGYNMLLEDNSVPFKVTFHINFGVGTAVSMSSQVMEE